MGSQLTVTPYFCNSSIVFGGTVQSKILLNESKRASAWPSKPSLQLDCSHKNLGIKVHIFLEALGYI